VSVLGTVAFFYEWDYPRAEELLRRAIARQPNAAESHVYLAHLLSNLGRHDEALAEIGQARSLDPNLLLARSLEGQFLVMARRYDEHSRDWMRPSNPRRGSYRARDACVSVDRPATL
jgi:tetratricopeptide (TPR) repeat protein